MSELKVKQLYEKVDGEYIPFNPQIDLNCILESVTARSIEFIFHHYNFFSCDWTDTAELTRAQVPPQLRRSGLWITYKPNSQTRITERFKGSDLDASVYEKWIDSDYWENLDFELLLKAAEEAIKNIFYNINNYPTLKCLFEAIVRKWLGETIDEDYLRQLLIELLGDIEDLLRSIVIQYFNSPEFSLYIEGLLREIITDMLDDLLAEYFEDIQNTLTSMERVIANALARHELAITELQNQVAELQNS